jgi:hypothetical protein
MANKIEQYYDLDDIGIVGVSKKRSAAQVIKDAQETSAFIKAHKLGQASAKVTVTKAIAVHSAHERSKSTISSKKTAVKAAKTR